MVKHYELKIVGSFSLSCQTEILNQGHC